MRINISIDNTLLTQVDEYAEKYSYDRSELIAQALRKMIFKEKEEPDVSLGKVPVMVSGIQSKNTHYKGEKSGDYTWQWCKANKVHPFVAGDLRECLHVRFVDGDGEPAYFEGKYYSGWTCKECLDKMNGIAPDGMGFEEVAE